MTEHRQTNNDYLNQIIFCQLNRNIANDLSAKQQQYHHITVFVQIAHQNITV